MNASVALPVELLAQDPDMTINEWQMYCMGWRARSEGYPLSACNMGIRNPMRGFWVAGWIDLDIELGR